MNLEEVSLYKAFYKTNLKFLAEKKSLISATERQLDEAQELVS